MRSKRDPEKESPKCPVCGAHLIDCFACGYEWDEVYDGDLWREK